MGVSFNKVGGVSFLFLIVFSFVFFIGLGFFLIDNVSETSSSFFVVSFFF
jgi:hypothetical protein